MPSGTVFFFFFLAFQLIVKIRVEREENCFEDFDERWMTFARLVGMNNADIEWNLELTGHVLPRKTRETVSVGKVAPFCFQST